jgi:predicted DNA-binding ArsR family transcriptional regulator
MNKQDTKPTPQLRRLNILQNQIQPNVTNSKNFHMKPQKPKKNSLSTISFILRNFLLPQKKIQNIVKLATKRSESYPNLFDKILKSFQGSGRLSTASIQAFNNILFLVINGILIIKRSILFLLV